MARPRLHDDALRERLLNAATEAIARQGDDFALRPLAEAVGTSTTAVYSLFGSRGALVEAVTLRVTSRYGDLLGRIQHEDPIDALEAAAVAYRSFSQKHTPIFNILFHGGLNSEQMSKALVFGQDWTTERVTRLVDDGILEGTPRLIALSLTAAVHGFIELELTGDSPADGGIDARYVDHFHRIFLGWATAKGREVHGDRYTREPSDIEALFADVLN